MREFDIEKMLFTISPEKHGKEEVINLLCQHPEVQFVSFVGIDLGGHDTDEKIHELIDYSLKLEACRPMVPALPYLKSLNLEMQKSILFRTYL